MFRIIFVVILLISLIILWEEYHKYKNIDYYTNYEIENVFWTGGYDSTFMVCKFLLLDKKVVQPLYITSDLDNCKDCSYKRKNLEIEKKTQYSIIKKIKKKYPKYAANLRPIKFISDVEYNENTTKKIKKLNLFRRKYHQYTTMATYTYNKKLFVNVGVCNSNDYWNPFFEKNLINTRIKYKNHPFYYLKFPIHNLTKKAMLSIAKKNNFDDILNMTWSCWFPVNNKSCGKCPMCLERIIKHPAMF